MHISDIKKFNRCPRLYQKSKTGDSSYFSFYNIQSDVVQTVADKLQIQEYQSGGLNETNEDTAALAEKCPYVFRARFEYEDLRIKVPLIQIEGQNVVIYDFVLNTSIGNDEYLNLKYMQYVLEHLGYTIKEVYLLNLNKDYIREEELDGEQLWNCTNQHGDITIKEYLDSLELNVPDIINRIKTYTDDKFTQYKPKCTGRTRCSYYEECFPQYANQPDNSILTLVSSQYKIKMFDKGIRYLRDADPNLLEGNKVQKAQIAADLQGGLYLDSERLSQWMEEAVVYPISFLDFEWDLYPIPPYRMMKPMDVLVFQYSLHVYDGKKMKHYQYIGYGDDREELVRSLVENMPDSGTVFAYNAKGAEKIRINEFAIYFPEYADKLHQINQRMRDLADPFINSMVYDVRMRGNFTLKVIEEMMDSDNSYKKLDVGNGMEAVAIHRKLELCEDDAQRQMYLDELYEYCGLDTYSLYEVFNWLNRLLEKDNSHHEDCKEEKHNEG